MKLRVFTVPNCGACQAVKDFLRQQGADFIELDVTANFANLRQLRRVTAGRQVPVTVSGDGVVVGYDPAALSALLANKERHADDSES
ncbi:MAG: glutaredoxin domain-containing protein [Desulfobacca sp.]|uniref:glutaredoxin domain-containing protein n=1 Tax=Desulfobacca sp. TaxID=2067990 RepID=UPI00404924B1